MRRAILAGLVVVTTACARRPPGVPPAPPGVSEAGLDVRLVWSAPVDLDLYVTDPRGETFYYANPGAVFGGDARCADDGPPVRIERARWVTPEAGRYRVGVDFPETCAGAMHEATFRVVLDRAGRRTETVGRATRQARQPLVVEVDIP